jgi:predicted kinase
MATLHVLCGLPGSGKSTFAQGLIQERSAIRFANDDWMLALFGRNPPESEFRVVFAKIEMLQWRLAADLLRRGLDVIWDYGVWSRSDRLDLYRRCSETGAAFVLYEIVCDFETAVRRVTERGSSEEPNLLINRSAMEQFRTRFEAPSSTEGFEVIRIQGEPGATDNPGDAQ